MRTLKEGDPVSSIPTEAWVRIGEYWFDAYSDPRALEKAADAYEHATTVPDLVAGLVALGVRVHAVEPARISLEERLLGILRTGAENRAGGQR